ncbi:MAG: hypothetical protein WCY57_08710, partial [Micavibrio sp.]
MYYFRTLGLCLFSLILLCPQSVSGQDSEAPRGGSTRGHIKPAPLEGRPAAERGFVCGGKTKC